MFVMFVLTLKVKVPYLKVAQCAFLLSTLQNCLMSVKMSEKLYFNKFFKTIINQYYEFEF
jgi:hypothetical protein